ncbi:DUF3619 family protein [Lampropedia aestuarii]|uniref:DUF3619 family protein n=1 Tax=Lampropedia aestuarii TaxID=2562762 RepID=UPI0024692179|nr:DUF3619 family protein [Lampropedia aestuarii]MDH5855885.1 DUF3619 family protein [Lampropedia aestuarii]
MNETKSEMSEHDIDRLGQLLAKPLRQNESRVTKDISERLRVARMQAMDAHRVVLAHRTAETAAPSSTAVKKQLAWWKKLLAAIPVAAAGAGIVFMQGAVSDDGTGEMIETDLQILSSPVPPSALSDPAFLQYLKTQNIDMAKPAPSTAATQSR